MLVNFIRNFLKPQWAPRKVSTWCSTHGYGIVKTLKDKTKDDLIISKKKSISSISKSTKVWLTAELPTETMKDTKDFRWHSQETKWKINQESFPAKPYCKNEDH